MDKIKHNMDDLRKIVEEAEGFLARNDDLPSTNGLKWEIDRAKTILAGQQWRWEKPISEHAQYQIIRLNLETCRVTGDIYDDIKEWLLLSKEWPLLSKAGKTRLLGCLRNMGVKRLSDLSLLDRETVMSVPHFGKKSMAVLEELMRLRGVRFADDPSLITQRMVDAAAAVLRGAGIDESVVEDLALRVVDAALMAHG